MQIMYTRTNTVLVSIVEGKGSTKRVHWLLWAYVCRFCS